MNVLAGADELFRMTRVGMVYCEIMLVPTYVGQAGYVDIMNYLKGHGFLLYGIYDLWKKDDRVLQFDALFVNEKLVLNHWD